MLLILPLLLCFLTDAKEIGTTRRCREIQAFPQNSFPETKPKMEKALRAEKNANAPGVHLPSKEWDFKLVDLAFEELMKEKFENVNARVKAERDFNTSDTSPVAAKVILALAGPLKESQRQIRALRNGTHFGCNGLLRKNYTEGHDKMEIICLYRTGKNLEKITHEARMMLKRLNKWLNPRLKWNKNLVQLAYEELMHTRSVRATAKVKGKYDFKTSDPTPMEVQVIIAISTHFGTKQRKIRRLPAGTLFGCNGIVINRYKQKINRIEVACLYMRVRNRREDTSEN